MLGRSNQLNILDRYLLHRYRNQQSKLGYVCQSCHRIPSRAYICYNRWFLLQTSSHQHIQLQLGQFSQQSIQLLLWCNTHLLLHYIDQESMEQSIQIVYLDKRNQLGSPNKINDFDLSFNLQNIE